jgi:hypothetical protein
MTSPDHPADFASLVSRRVDRERSLVVHLAVDSRSTAASNGLERICSHLDLALADAERIAVTDPTAGHQFLEHTTPGSLLVVEQLSEDVPEDAWGPLVTLFANARYRGVHAVLVTPRVPTLVGRAVNVRVEGAGDSFEGALLEPAPEDPERTQEIELGTL